MIHGDGSQFVSTRGPMRVRDFERIECKAANHDHRADGSGRDDGEWTDGFGRCLLGVMAPCHPTSGLDVAYDRIDRVLMLRCADCLSVFAAVGVAP